MVGLTTRRGFCAVLAATSVAGCNGVLGGREREQIAGVRDSPPSVRTWEVELNRRDRIIMQYRPNAEAPSQLVIEGPDGEVVHEETLAGRSTVSYRTEAAGTFTITLEFGDGARVNLFVET